MFSNNKRFSPGKSSMLIRSQKSIFGQTAASLAASTPELGIPPSVDNNSIPSSATAFPPHTNASTISRMLSSVNRTVARENPSSPVKAKSASRYMSPPPEQEQQNRALETPQPNPLSPASDLRQSAAPFHHSVHMPHRAVYLISTPPRAFSEHKLNASASFDPAKFFKAVFGSPQKPQNDYKKESASSSHPKPLLRKVTPLRALYSPKKLSSQLLQQQEDSKTWLICAQHALGTTADMLQFIQDRFGVSQIYCLDKLYSTHHEVWERISKVLGTDHVVRLKAPKKPWKYSKNFVHHLDQLFQKMMTGIKASQEKPSKVIFLNDGGRMPSDEILSELDQLAEQHQFPIYLIEQTTAGDRLLRRHPPRYPFISVASEVIKRNEDPFIGELACQKVEEIVLKWQANRSSSTEKKPKIGIIGLGNIGRAVAECLLKKGLEVFFYDTQDQSRCLKGSLHRIHSCSSREALIQASDIIIGCTGLDTLKGLTLNSQMIQQDKWFVSASSECIEFKSFMMTYASSAPGLNQYTENPFMDIVYKVFGHDLTFLYAGFPATFNHTKPHAVEPQYIANTRVALLAAFYQWARKKIKPEDLKRVPHGKPVKLNTSVQRFITREWLKVLSKDKKLNEITQRSTQLGLSGSPVPARVLFPTSTSSMTSLSSGSSYTNTPSSPVGSTPPANSPMSYTGQMSGSTSSVISLSNSSLATVTPSSPVIYKTPVSSPNRGKRPMSSSSSTSYIPDSNKSPFQVDTPFSPSCYRTPVSSPSPDISEISMGIPSATSFSSSSLAVTAHSSLFFHTAASTAKGEQPYAPTTSLSHTPLSTGSKGDNRGTDNRKNVTIFSRDSSKDWTFISPEVSLSPH